MDKYVVTINIDTKLLGKNNMISPYLTQLNPSTSANTILLLG